MAADAVIGIDLGTTAVKAGVVAGDGQLLAKASLQYTTTRRPGGIAEQNPDDWIALIRALLERFAAQGHDVSALGLCSQVNTHVFVDADCRPLLPAILWQDGRASAEAAELDARITPEQKTAWWGTPMPIDASHALARMLWLARHHKDLWARTAHVLLPKDYCLFCLTGEIATDPVSNVGLVDTELGYIEDLFALVPGAREKMAPLVLPTQIAGAVRAGLPFAGRPMVSGTMDAWSGLVGAGGASPGSSVYLSGTSEILGISSNTVVPTPGAIVFPQCSGIRMHAAPTQSGGDAKVWFASAHGLSLEQMSDMVAKTARSAATPLFLPQLEGERAPIWDADLRAAFVGVTRQTRLPDFARAVYEGVAFAARWALETLEASSGVVNDTVFCGGNGFRSDAWDQIRADILGKQLRCIEAGEPGILGAANMAAIGTGAFAGFEDAFGAMVRFDRVFEPDPLRHAAYSELFALYKSAIATTAELNAKVAQTSAGLVRLSENCTELSSTASQETT